MQQGWGDNSYSTSQWQASDKSPNSNSAPYCSTVSPGGRSAAAFGAPLVNRASGLGRAARHSHLRYCLILLDKHNFNDMGYWGLSFLHMTAITATGGAVSMRGWEGAFSGFKTMEFWVKRNNAGIPDFSLQISSTSKVNTVNCFTWQ